jgi:hypothetical protein
VCKYLRVNCDCLLDFGRVFLPWAAIDFDSRDVVLAGCMLVFPTSKQIC